MNTHPGFETDCQRLAALAQALVTLQAQVQLAASMASDCLQRGGKLMWCGNGGSAAECQHLAAELTGRLHSERRPLAALALTTDTSALTCIGNDYGFDAVFARQVQALGRAGDLLIVLSTSGQSPNVRLAAQVARAQGVTVLGLLGRDGGALRALCDVALVVPSHDTARIQEAHLLIGHHLCAQIERNLGLVA